MEYIFAAKELCKRYGNFSALNGLTMRVPAGSIYGFVGRNGAGKTTLIRLLCGLQAPSSGSFSLFGVGNSEADAGRARGRIGALVESPAVYLDMTAEQNLRQQHRILGLSGGDIPALMEQAGLAKTGRKKVRQFSQGMRQKLGIAMAMVGKPAFLVLDEPINGLDPQGITELRELILRLNREAGTTFLISSHILPELARLATHYGFIDGGRMVREMTARELESACRTSTRVAVSDTAPLSAALTRMGVEHRILSKTQADLFDGISLTRLARELAQDNCEIYQCYEQEANLEEYFLQLVGGEQNA